MAGLVLYFEKQAPVRLDAIADVGGPGIYSLFYSGNIPFYRPISGSERPIYVGKAVPPGSRKGDRVDESSPALQRRIREHSKSIDEVDNLEACRRLPRFSPKSFLSLLLHGFGASAFARNAYA